MLISPPHRQKQGNSSRRFGLSLISGLGWVLFPGAAFAQMHHVDAPERVTRALGVYEWTGELDKPTAARFVPVSLFINGTLQDAGLYLARPVPFALGTGDVYSLERAGQPQGLLDLDYAQHVVVDQPGGGEDTGSAWYGYGKFTPQAAPRMANLHPSARLPVIQADGKPTAGVDAADGRPHMSRRENPPSGDSSKAGESGTPASGTEPPSSGSKTPSATNDNTDDSDRPTLRHRDPSQDATRRREYGTKSKQASVTAVGPGPGDDPDRPVLGRNTDADNTTPPLTGLPADMHQEVGISDPARRPEHNFAREWDTPAERTLTEASLEAAARTRVASYLLANRLVPSSAPLPVEKTLPVADQSATGQSASDVTKADAAADDAATPPKLQRGVPSKYKSSDAAAKGAPATPPAPSPATAVSSAASRTSPPASHPAARRVTTGGGGKLAPAPLTLKAGSLAGYTLSYGGLPTFVYTASASAAPAVAVTGKSAAARLPATPGSPAVSSPAVPVPASPTHLAVFVTVVAQRLPSGELQVVLSSVTDSLHQDRSPRLRFVDAVDPDASHRASLLFELRGTASRQFALYRLTAAQAEQMFTTAPIE